MFTDSEEIELGAEFNLAQPDTGADGGSEDNTDPENDPNLDPDADANSGDDPDPENDPTLDPNANTDPDPNADPNAEGSDAPDLTLENPAIQSLLTAEFGVESVADLREIVADYETLLAEHEELKAKQPGTLEFKNDWQKKVFEHVSRFEESNDLQGGFQSFIRLSTLDVSKLEHKDAMRELYILEHPDLSADDAEIVFEESYYKNYEETVTSATPIRLRIDGQTAINKLKEKQEQVLAPAAPDAASKEIDQVPVQITQSINQHVQDFRGTLAGLTTLTFSPDGATDEGSSFNFAVTPEQLKLAEKSMVNHLSDPANYDEDGTLLSEFDPIKSRNQLLIAQNYDNIVEAAIQHGINVGKAKRIKEVAAVKPNREATTGTQKPAQSSEYDVARDAILSMPDKF